MPSTIAPGEVVREARIPTRRCAATPACARSSSRACIPKNVTFAAIVGRARRRSRPRDPAQEGQPLRGGGDLDALLARVVVGAVARDLPRSGPEPRSSRSRCCSATRVRIDSHRRLDAADPGRARTTRSARRWSRRSSPSPWRCSSRWCWRSCCCGRFTSSAAASRASDAASSASARHEPAGRVRRARHVLQRGQCAALGRSLADGRPGRPPRVGGRASRGRGGHRQPGRTVALRQPLDAGDRARRRGGAELGDADARRPPAAPAAAENPHQPSVARAGRRQPSRMPGGDSGERLF